MIANNPKPEAIKSSRVLPLKMQRPGVLILSVTLAVFCFCVIKPIRSLASQPFAGQASSANATDTQPCHAEGKLEITLACDYMEAPPTAPNVHFEPHVVLNHAKLWFRAKDDSKMRVELTFTNASGHAISQARTVYIAIDDESGENHIRRQLPRVDFTKLVPNEPIAFSEVLRAPAFQPGHYTIYLWIPNPDPSFKFDATHNFLLSNAGLPDEKSGLNTIATFTVTH